MGCQGHKEEKPSEHFSGEDVDVLEVMLADATFQAADGELPFAPLHVYPEAMNEYLTELFKLADKNGDSQSLSCTLPAHFLNAVCALPPAIFAHPFRTDTAHWHSVLTYLLPTRMVTIQFCQPTCQCVERLLRH